MAKPTAFRRVRDRLATLQERGGDAAPVGPGTPTQQAAMRESIAILADPALMTGVQAARRAVAIADVVGLEQLGGNDPVPPGEWSVAIAGPVARAFADAGTAQAAALRETLGALSSSPAEQGHALGMGLVGVWSTHGDAHRILYAVHRAQRLVTVLSVEIDPQA